MSFTREQVAAACIEYGPAVGPLPLFVDGKKLLWAMAGNESSFGLDVTPRHEPAFDVGGPFATTGDMPELLAKWGSAAACSYGPWQILLTNAPQYAPTDFNDIDLACQATVSYLNSRLRAFKPQTLTAIGQIWNSGEPRQNPSPGVIAYVTELQANYNVPMPEVV